MTFFAFTFIMSTHITCTAYFKVLFLFCVSFALWIYGFYLLSFCILCTNQRILDHKICAFLLCSLFFFSSLLQFDWFSSVSISLHKHKFIWKSCIIRLNICFWSVRCFSAVWFTWFICMESFFSTFRWHSNEIVNSIQLICKLKPIFLVLSLDWVHFVFIRPFQQWH